jgi:hypothetical protein
MAGISRSQAKTINLGLFYGMGKAKLQAELGLSTKAEAEKLFNQYHDNVPFVKQLMNIITREANEFGMIKTLLGRRCRFDKWEVDEFKFGVMSTPLTKEEALYRRIFWEFFGSVNDTVITEMWRPKWTTVTEPSARYIVKV